MKQGTTSEDLDEQQQPLSANYYKITNLPDTLENLILPLQ
jgi:hypothetical protein